jgi:hypothetical protein
MTASATLENYTTLTDVTQCLATSHAVDSRPNMSEVDSSEYSPLRERKIADRRYELHSPGQCSCCGEHILEIWLLGFAAAEHRLMTAYEDYLHDGIAMSE